MRILIAILVLALGVNGYSASAFSFASPGFVRSVQRGGNAGVDYSFAFSNLYAVWDFRYTTNIGGVTYVPSMYGTNHIRDDDRFLSPFPTMDGSRYLTNRDPLDVKSVYFDDGTGIPAWLYQPFGDSQAAVNWTPGFSGVIWVWCTNAPSGTLLCRYSASDPSWLLDVNGDGNGNFRFLVQTNNVVFGSVQITNNVPLASLTNTWLPIQFLSDQDNRIGLKVGTNAWAFAPIKLINFSDVTPCGLTVGNRGDSTFLFDGLADLYVVWTKVQSTNDLQKLVNGVLAKDPNWPIPPR